MSREDLPHPNPGLEVEAEASRRLIGESGERELSQEEKFAKIRDLVTAKFSGQMPDVFFMHTGGIDKNERGPMGYRSTVYSQLSEHGIATGGRTRIIAGAEIAKAVPELKIVTNSFNRFDPEMPSMATVNKEELVRRGIDPDRISLEENSFSTVTQLVEMVNEAVKNKWLKVVAMTNTYHLPRMSAMYEHLEEIINDAQFQETLKKFRQQGVQVEFVCAEDVLRIMGGHFIPYLEAVENMPEFARTKETEAQGLADLKAGKYRVVLKPEKPRGPS